MANTNPTFTVIALAKFHAKLVELILNQVKSSRVQFLYSDGMDASLNPHIAVVDVTDPDMLSRHAALLTSHPFLKTICVIPGLPDPSLSQYQVKRTHLVSQLIPLLEQAAQSIKQVEQAPPEEASRLRALVVDDSVVVRVHLAKALTLMGFDCDVAASARPALDKLEIQTYDVIFVDVIMPDMDGYKLTREIKRNKVHKATPVIILTSQSSPFDRARGALAGCDTYLTKPVELKRLQEATMKCLIKTGRVANSRNAS